MAVDGDQLEESIGIARGNFLSCVATPDCARYAVWTLCKGILERFLKLRDECQGIAAAIRSVFFTLLLLSGP